MIGGNISARLQTKTTVKNGIGEAVSTWSDAHVFSAGWLGFQSGDAQRETYNVKIQESTHVYLTDYDADAYALADTDCRLIVRGRIYDVLLIDNPDELDEQLEIYLKYVGGGFSE